jgi:hypothetical protein
MRGLDLLTRGRRLALAGATIAGMLLAAAPAASAHRTAVYAPDAKPFGMTYGEWSAEWWKQAVRQTGAPGTPFAAGEVDCTAMGARNVVFLVGTTTSVPVSRSCTIPHHVAILLPAINAECSEVEGNGTTDAELRACAAGFADEFTNVHVVVDGVALAGLDAFRFDSPLFRFSPVAGNVFGIPPAVRSKSVADGYWVMLRKLGKGVHTVSFGGAFPAVGFETETTYTLTVR